MPAKHPPFCRFVELAARSDREVQLLIKIPAEAHSRILAVGERYHLHPLRMYRDAFDAGVANWLEEFAKHEDRAEV